MAIFGYGVARSDRLWIGGYRIHAPESIQFGNYRPYVPPSVFTCVSAHSAHVPDAGDFNLEAVLEVCGDIRPFDVTIGQQNIFRKERYKIDLDLTAINAANKTALYNFLSTFSGTHFVTPRALTARVTLNF